ncbi:LOW QUALITY PROTEIN: voltage-dependent calcium channel subunit alpha-2/delta-3-like [Amphiura filiformis]|uniref:LOW QUALITY PROTEIN: voltage-dependent calcium channel subunit alpha-2/delta-3-like n=1 Tax=Amphiura filiformis TaxID=82378 RepID=UPI003B22227A
MMMSGTMWRLVCVAIWVFILLGQKISGNDDPNVPEQRVKLDKPTMEMWAKKFGTKLFEFSKEYAGLDFLKTEFEEKHKDTVRIDTIDGLQLVRDMATKMEDMLSYKVDAVGRIVAEAEKAHVLHKYDNDTKFRYFNAMLINEPFENDTEDSLRLMFDLEENEHFDNLLINTTISTVQVATNVYNLAPEILNGINETESLDKVFIANYEQDPTLTWQYFGSKYGFFRNFPGAKWTMNEKGLDLFDCRKRGWYIQAATSPKDIVILMDASGSMTGLRMEIARHTVRVVIKTLSDDDFFNVIVFNTESKAIQDCFNGTLVQANSDNKELILGELDGFKPGGIADFSQALIEGFTLLKNFNKTDRGANCNQAIMVITDGATVYHKEVFDEYNKEKKVRIFTYLIGREIADSGVVRRMACDNKGYYTQIATIADVEENAVKYIHVLSRPMVIQQDHNTVWTNVYMDTAGLQLMTSVAQPVFNKKPEEKSEGILLGVAGVDVPIFEMLKLTPAYKLGVNGYPFGITNNGYLLFHPDLRPKYGPGECTKPTYNSVDLAEVELSDPDEREYHRDSQELEQNQIYNTSSFSGPEWELRKNMVDRNTNKQTMEVWKYISSMHSFVLNDVAKRRIAKRTNHYYYVPLKRTPFSLGIVLAGDTGHNVLMGPDTFKKVGNRTVGDLCPITEGQDCCTACEYLLSDRDSTVTVAKWQYCRLNNSEIKTFTREENVIRYLNASVTSIGVLSSKCDHELINHLLFDASLTKGLVKHWLDLFSEQNLDPEPSMENSTDVSNETTTGMSSTDAPTTARMMTTESFVNITESNTANNESWRFGVLSADDILIVFVGTKGGLTRTYMNPALNHTDASLNFTWDYPNTIEEEYYQRAAEVPKDNFVYSVPYADEIDYLVDLSDVLVTASVAFRVTKDRKDAIAAALGYKMRQTALWELLSATSLERHKDCNSRRKDCDLNCESDEIECVIIDNNGYIVASKHDTEIGNHFARYDKNKYLFRYMLDEKVSIFETKELVDYQAMCNKPENTEGAASHLLSPFLSFTGLLSWWAEQFILFLLHLNFYHDWDESYVEAQPNTQKCEEAANGGHSGGGEVGQYESCDEVQTFFLANFSNLPLHSSASDFCTDDCTKSFSIQKIEYSNLMLIVQDMACECNLMEEWEDFEMEKIELDPRKVEYNETAWCDKLKRQRHRRRPDTCHFQHEDENSTDCGRGSLLRPSTFLITIVCALCRLLNTQLTSLRS